MNKSEKYSEIILLGQMLQERKIEHEQHDLYDGYQIIVPLPEPTKEISVIEHQCSYGSIMNLLEIWVHDASVAALVLYDGYFLRWFRQRDYDLISVV